MGYPSKKRRAFWQQHVEAFGKSGMSAEAYCEEHGLKPGTLKVWRRQFEVEAKAGKRKPSAFAAVAIRDGVSVRAIRVTLPDGTAIDAAGDLEATARLVRLLREGSL